MTPEHIITEPCALVSNSLIYDERQREYLIYDLASDPAENFDIADLRPTLAKELAHRLHTWRELQIDYYSHAGLQGRAYPLILTD